MGFVLHDESETFTKILPITRSGLYYDDGWISPYLRVDFLLSKGRYMLHFEVYTPKPDVMLLVRVGVTPLFRSNPMPQNSFQRHSIPLPTLVAAGVLPISFRSSLSWRADNDSRVLGVVLPSLYCTVEADDGVSEVDTRS